MSGHRSFDQLRASTLERQERVAACERSLRTALHLRALRTRSGITQLQLAERMAVSQEFVSKLERGTDPRLSSITRYVKAMGGEVKIVVAMPNQEPVVVSGYDGDDALAYQESDAREALRLLREAKENQRT